MASRNPRTIREKPPVRLIVKAVVIPLAVLAGIFYATWSMWEGVLAARMSGVIVSKEFIPAPEEQITVGRDGLKSERKEGEFILEVEVLQKGDNPKKFNVWVDKERFERVKVGDPFDVGPYVLRDEP